MSTTFAAFFLDHADCLSPTEKAQALMGAADALLREPTVARSFDVQLDLMALGDFLPAEGDTPEFTSQRGSAACSWGDFAFIPGGVLLAARELSDAAIGYADRAKLCTGCLHEQDRCPCSGERSPLL